jgi:hypothetical protein
MHRRLVLSQGPWAMSKRRHTFESYSKKQFQNCICDQPVAVAVLSGLTETGLGKGTCHVLAEIAGTEQQ